MDSMTETIPDAYDVLISADAEEPGVVFIDIFKVKKLGEAYTVAGNLYQDSGPSELIASLERKVGENTWLLALQADRWFGVDGDDASDALNIPNPLRGAAEQALDWLQSIRS